MLKKNILLSIILGAISTVISYFSSYQIGDFAGHGFPIRYYIGVWGMGMEWHISWISFIADILIWAIVWYLILLLMSWFKKRAKQV